MKFYLSKGLPWKEKWSEVAQSRPTLCDPMDCRLPGSLVHGIFQARVLEWVAIAFSRGSSWPRDRTQVSRIVGRRFTVWARSRQIFSVVLSVFLCSRHYFLHKLWCWHCCLSYLNEENGSQGRKHLPYSCCTSIVIVISFFFLELFGNSLIFRYLDSLSTWSFHQNISFLVIDHQAICMWLLWRMKFYVTFGLETATGSYYFSNLQNEKLNSSNCSFLTKNRSYAMCWV